MVQLLPEPPTETTLLLDNGGGYLKVGLLVDPESNVNAFTVPNALAKPAPAAIPAPASVYGKSRRPLGHLVGSEIVQAPDFSGMVFRRPHDRGLVINYDVQYDIWASVFSKDRGIGLADTSSTSLLLTEHLGVPVSVRHATDQLVFEAYSFAAYSFAPPQRLASAAFADSGKPPTCMVLDSGFSCTSAVPILHGQEIPTSARRLALGGKALTNLLKQIVSFRSWNMADETAVMTAVKERCCRVAMDYSSELVACRTQPPTHYLLPDPAKHTDPLGQILAADEQRQSTDQILTLRNECISIPEALFNPSDIGLEQAGAAELIVQSADQCDKNIRPDLYNKVILTGGNCLFPKFSDRVMDELRPLVPTDYDLNVHSDDDPISTTFRGGVRALREKTVPLSFFTREDYFESGSDAILRALYGD